MKIKTSELSGIALDWAVAKCGDMPIVISSGLVAIEDDAGFWLTIYSPSSNWSQGGPIIEREWILVGKHSNNECGALHPTHKTYYGATYLEAAMRCYVASRVGEEVDIPDELVKED